MTPSPSAVRSYGGTAVRRYGGTAVENEWHSPHTYRRSIYRRFIYRRFTYRPISTLYTS